MSALRQAVATDELPIQLEFDNSEPVLHVEISAEKNYGQDNVKYDYRLINMGRAVILLRTGTSALDNSRRINSELLASLHSLS